MSIPLRLLGMLWALLALGMLVSFWQGPYLFNLVSSFRVHLLLGLLVIGLPLSIFDAYPKRWVFLALPLAVAATFLSYFVPRSSQVNPAAGGQSRIVVANLLSSNHDLRRFLTWIAEEKPDIVGLTEVSPAHQQQLESLPYTHKTLLPKQGNFGLALLSRLKPSQVVVLDEDTPFPSLLATFPEYRVLLTHPVPPISPAARLAGDQQMERLMANHHDGSTPLLLIGDLNATGWDRRLRPLRDAGLVEARTGHGLLPTWPADRPFLWIPIDHIYLPEGWQSQDCRVGPNIGSDHFPLVCDAVWPASAAK
jgi:endonuclease/exonuclease/phosphatase (EEP) superfamily protein YafD